MKIRKKHAIAGGVAAVLVLGLVLLGVAGVGVRAVVNVVAGAVNCATGTTHSRAPGTPVSRVKGPLRAVPVPANVSRLGTGWRPSLEATFTGSKLDTSLWGTCYPWQSADGCTNFGNSDEYEWYTPAQDQVSGGVLHMTAQRMPTQGSASDGAAKTYAYRSGMVTTYPGFQFQYGYVQVVAKIPYGPGLWPALWLAAANKQWPPEIDMLEHYGTGSQYTEHLHEADMCVQAGAQSTVNLSGGWHTFGLYWSPSRIVWYIDGRPVMTASKGVPRQPMYFLADLAVYQQAAAGWKNGSSLDLRSVTVWQARAYR